MMAALMLDLAYYIYILVFGVYICLRLGCGKLSRREWRVFALLCPVLLLLQGVCLQLWNVDAVWMLYPLIVHVPMGLALALALKVKWNIAVVSVLVSYSMCQLPRWIGLLLDVLMVRPAASVLIHIAASQIVLILLDRFCLDPIHQAICSIRRLLRRFGTLPAVYYLYEYFMIYTRRQYVDIQALDELLATSLVLFFVLFAVAYQREMMRLEGARREAAALEMRLSQAEREVLSLRSLQEQTAIYRHDFRHHLLMIDGLISANQKEQAGEYIRMAQQEIDKITPERFCDNETVNLLLSAFKTRAGATGAELRVKAALPAKISLPDTELSVLLSNALENAVHAVAGTDEKGIDVYCALKQNRLLMEIRNPYAGEIAFRDGLPVSSKPGAHYGCRSIQSIAEKRKGMCTFEAQDGTFTLRIAIPMLD